MKNILKLATILLFVSTLAFGQAVPEAPKPHRFFDKTNITFLTTSAVAYVSDAYGSNQMMAYANQPICNRAVTHCLFFSGEANPIARPFVQTRTGTALFFGTGFAAEVGGMYLLHRHHHHRIERILPLVITGTEAYFGYRTISTVRTLQSFPKR